MVFDLLSPLLFDTRLPENKNISKTSSDPLSSAGKGLDPHDSEEIFVSIMRLLDYL